MNTLITSGRICRLTLLTAVLLLSATALPLKAQSSSTSTPISEKVSAAANEAEKKVQEAGEAASSQLELLWRRIDESRLKNRNVDEIVAWALMGLLVAGLLHRVGKLGLLANCVLGLIGAFIGGVIAHVTKINLGLGPILIRYEDLLCALIGGILLLVFVRWFMRRKTPKTEQ